MVTEITNYKTEIVGLLKKTDDIKFQIKLRRHENTELTKENNEKIAKYEEELIEVGFQIKETLTNSKEEAIKVKCGWAHFKAMNDKVIFTDATITEIKTEYPDNKDKYIKTSESLILNPIKKDLEDGVIVLKEMTVEKQDKKFEYKFTGGE